MSPVAAFMRYWPLCVPIYSRPYILTKVFIGFWSAQTQAFFIVFDSDPLAWWCSETVCVHQPASALGWEGRWQWFSWLRPKTWFPGHSASFLPLGPVATWWMWEPLWEASLWDLGILLREICLLCKGLAKAVYWAPLLKGKRKWHRIKWLQ